MIGLNMIPTPEFRAQGESVMVIVFHCWTLDRVSRLERPFSLQVWQVCWWGWGGWLLPNNQKVEPASWRDAKIWQSSWPPPNKAWEQSHPKIPDTPPPSRQLHFTCDLVQPVVRIEPLNTSPELQRLESLWLLSSAGLPFSVFLFTPPPTPFTSPSSPGWFSFIFLCVFFLKQPIFPPLFSFSYSILNLKIRLTLILIYFGFICIINSDHTYTKRAPGPSLYTKFGCLWKGPAIMEKRIFFR